MTTGHVGHLFITLASILRIPVYMHNVDASRVFRPSAWNAFGTEVWKAPTSVPARTLARSTDVGNNTNSDEQNRYIEIDAGAFSLSWRLSDSG